MNGTTELARTSGEAPTRGRTKTPEKPALPLLSREKKAPARAASSNETALDRSPAVALFLIGRGGGGHKAAAEALKQSLISAGVGWASSIEMVDGGLLLNEASGSISRFDGDEWYNWLMKRGYYRIAGFCGYIATTGIRLQRRKLERGFEAYFRARKPRVVVSFVPYFNRMYRHALHRSNPESTMVTVVTDMANTAAHTWIDPYDEMGKNHVVVAGTKELQDQAVALGFPEPNIIRASGMVVNPAFYQKAPKSADVSPAAPADSAPAAPHTPGPVAQQADTGTNGRLLSGGIPSDSPNSEQLEAGVRRPIGLVFFGGFAPNRTAAIARRALVSHPQLDLVIICGGNKTLERDLLAEIAGPRCVVDGLVPAQRVRELLQKATCVIGKPGPGVVAEAAVCGVPFVTERRAVMPQERCVLKWLEGNAIGVAVKSLESLPSDLLDRVDACREALDRLPPNRAVFEVAQRLRDVVEVDRA